MLVFVCERGRLPITNMYDADGDETDDPTQATAVVARLPNDEWLAAKVAAGKIVAGGLS